jgi:hypothetical protein
MTIIFSSLLAFLAACQSDHSANVPPPADVLADARNAPVPMPVTTPFDATPRLRDEYLEAYRDGYRSGLTGMNIIFRKPPAGGPPARSAGWRDGGDAGLKEYFFRKNRR